MGIESSRPSYNFSLPSGEEHLYLPSETLRVCTSPTRCICPPAGRPYLHPKVWYESPENKGNYQDPMDLLALMASGPGGSYSGGGGGGLARGMLPWKDAKDWTGRDYDMFGDVMNEYLTRMRAKGCRGNDGGYQHLQRQQMAGMPADATVNMLMTMMPPPGVHMNMTGPDDDYYWWGGGRPSRRRRRERPSSSSSVDYDRMEESLREFKRQAHEFKQFMDGVNELVFGSEIDQRREAFQRSLWKNLQGLVPQLGQMLAMQQQQQSGMGAGFGGAMPPPLGGQMPAPFGANLAMPPPGMSGFPGMHCTLPPMAGGIPGFGAMGPFGMNPLATAGGHGDFGGGIMDPVTNSLLGGPGGLAGVGIPEVQPPIGFGGRRRPGLLGGGRGGRRDYGRDFLDDDFGAGSGGRRGRNRRGGRWDDEEDLFGGGDDGMYVFRRWNGSSLKHISLHADMSLAR
ncbi:hypothetical protein K431DRAFT_71685 [Polychaeton citri CBS 116435]|uniref:Uncharacterized protein n=1 Tax=Polychaeton citri CBS 116435 TaxID=1314669 RepID=A0A9P4QB04_9PEZI|nr:hypothetical protein K431DRAFT_71685 [Polychaeton citri CBS 116435]